MVIMISVGLSSSVMSTTLMRGSRQLVGVEGFLLLQAVLKIIHVAISILHNSQKNTLTHIPIIGPVLATASFLSLR